MSPDARRIIAFIRDTSAYWSKEAETAWHQNLPDLANKYEAKAHVLDAIASDIEFDRGVGLREGSQLS